VLGGRQWDSSRAHGSLLSVGVSACTGSRRAPFAARTRRSGSRP
jgi:hypothetical protein